MYRHLKIKTKIDAVRHRSAESPMRQELVAWGQNMGTRVNGSKSAAFACHIHRD